MSLTEDYVRFAEARHLSKEKRSSRFSRGGLVELGDRIIEFITYRKISFDGECHHSRIPLEIVKILEQYSVQLNGVQWEGVWRDKNKFHIVLTFGTAEAEQQSQSENVTEEIDQDSDYVILKD